MTTLKLTPKIQNYLAAIHEICLNNSVARITDIARYSDVSTSNISNTMREMAAKGIVNYRPYSYVTIADDYLDVARMLFERKNTFKKFLEDELSLQPETAARNSEVVFYLDDELIVNRMKDIMKHRKVCDMHKRNRIRWSKSNRILCDNRN